MEAPCGSTALPLARSFLPCCSDNPSYPAEFPSNPKARHRPLRSEGDGRVARGVCLRARLFRHLTGAWLCLVTRGRGVPTVMVDMARTSIRSIYGKPTSRGGGATVGRAPGAAIAERLLRLPMPPLRWQRESVPGPRDHTRPATLCSNALSIIV